MRNKDRQRVVLLRSNPVAPDPRVENTGKALLNDGYSVSIVGWDRTGDPSHQKFVLGIPISHFHLRAEYGSGMGNLIKLLQWQIFLWRWLIKHQSEFDILHACDFDTILPALWCKWLYKKRLVYDIFDFYADHLRNTPSLFKKIIRWLDYWAISRADAVIIADDTRREQISGSHPRKLVVIYNTPDDLLVPAAPNEEQIFSIIYVGILQVERGLLEMIEVVQKHPEWRLELAGFGGDAELIRNAAAENPNIRWHGRIDYDSALALSRQASVLFATYDPVIPNHRYSSPNKLFEAMMLGKPVIVSRDTNMDKIVVEAESGLVVPYADIPALEAALLRLSTDKELCSQLGMNARRAYETRFSRKIMNDRLLSLYAEIQEEEGQD
ncbi:MAG TPA: glycosyltransferase family 4 protein [Anaerolineaceae bacterium]|nr:glycosyltransferase family 4 protein [Anaerolineaceae bacterium]